MSLLKYRYRVLSLLFLLSIITYLDRVCISVAGPRMQQDLGITPPNNAKGAMQDVHWYGGIIGGVFQGYTLGNILSAQFYETAVKAYPEIPAQIANGQFETLHGWLVEHVYRHGKKFTMPELVERATGSPITIEPYIRYLRTKYGELYSLS